MTGDSEREDGARLWPNRPQGRIRRRLVAVMMVLAAVVTVLGYVERHTIYRQVMLAVVADVSSDTPDPEHQALEVLGQLRQIAPLTPTVVIDDDPAATLIRGWGWCDAMSMSYVQTLERLGMRGRLLFLWNESGQSPHTIASVYLNDVWRIVDPQTGVVPRTAAGEIATVDDIASGAAPMTGDWLVPADYARATVFYESPESRVDPRGLLRMVARLAASIAPQLVQDLYLLTPPPTFVDVAGQVWEDWSEPADRAYWRARNYDIFGRDGGSRGVPIGDPSGFSACGCSTAVPAALTGRRGRAERFVRAWSDFSAQ